MARAIEFAFWPEDQLAMALVVSFGVGSNLPIGSAFHDAPK